MHTGMESNRYQFLSPSQIFYNKVNLLLSCFFICKMMAVEAFCIKRPGVNSDSKPGKKFLFFGNILIW